MTSQNKLRTSESKLNNAEHKLASLENKLNHKEQMHFNSDSRYDPWRKERGKEQGPYIETRGVARILARGEHYLERSDR